MITALMPTFIICQKCGNKQGQFIFPARNTTGRYIFYCEKCEHRRIFKQEPWKVRQR